MKKFTLFTILFALFCLFSCKESDNEVIVRPPTNEPSSAVLVFSEETTNNYVASVTEDEFVLNPNTPNDKIPKVGTIIQLPVSPNSPYGFLGKVVSVQKNGDITIKTESVALDEAYPNLSLDTIINILDDIEGVFDEDGNPVEYYIEDGNDNASTRAAGEFDWKEKTINIPIPTDLLGEQFSAKGSMKVSFAGSKFDLDNKDALRYLNLELHPSITVSASITTNIKSIPNNKPFQTKPLKIKARAVVGPVIIPITIPISFKAGVTGDIESTIQLNFSKSCNAYIRYANEKWDKGCEPIKNGDENPWYVTSFDVNGSLYAGIDVEFIAGIYTTNAGIGFELFPNASLSANASLSSLNPFDLNPDITFGVNLESRVFCMAKLFNKKLQVFDIKLPQKTFYRRSMSMFPNIDNFDAQGGASSADISYQSDSYYFLQGLGVKTGTTVFENDKKTEFGTYYPAHTSIDKLGIRYYNAHVSGLRSGAVYYAAPTISWLKFKWFGDKKEFTTESGYTVCWRCQGREDIWSLHLDLNSSNTNIDMTFDAPTYNGQTKRFMRATYNPSSQTISGTVETLFYDDPNDRRIDGFMLDLSSDDTGYVTNSKVLDNGACYTQIRFVKDSSASRAKGRSIKIKDDSEGLDPCGYGERIQ